MIRLSLGEWCSGCATAARQPPLQKRKVVLWAFTGGLQGLQISGTFYIIAGWTKRGLYSAACFPTRQNSFLFNLFTGSVLIKVKRLKRIMLLRVVEASSEQLASWNNGDILPSWVSKGKQTKWGEKSRGLNHFILAHLKGPHYCAARQCPEPIAGSWKCYINKWERFFMVP